MTRFITNGELRIEAERLCDESERLRAENARLVDDNARLQEIVTNDELHMRKVLEENEKLRELCADMLMCLTWTDEPHGYMEDGCGYCRFKGKTHGACGLGMFRGRSSELGVKVK